MVIQHNMSAMNGDRMYGIVETDLRKSTEKLSSGYRINRAADDAAGLAMSEKMRRQIRGLTQASANAQDGVSMVQSAEGALNEVHDMLQRMNELCVKAANETLTSKDRDYIQEEISGITNEIDRVGASTTFNEMKLFNGLPQDKTTAVPPQGNVNGAKGTITQTTDDEHDSTYTINNLQNGDVAFIPAHGSVGDTYLKLATAQEIADYEQEWRDYEASGGTLPEPVARDGSSAAQAKLVGEKEILQEIGRDLARTNLAANSNEADSISVSYTKGPSQTVFDIHFYGPLNVTLQVGSEADHTYSFTIDSVNASALGVLDVNVRGNDNTGALDGIDKVKTAIDRNSQQRAKLGAVQNRLDHIIKNLDNVVENTTAAESRIRDTDMAHEAQYNTNTNVIAQAGQMVLAQANQSKQGVLNLLQ